MSNLWEGYDSQEVVLLEDIDPFHCKLGHDIKIWADRYSFRGRVLYGSIVLRPAKIVITSQYHPDEIWPSHQMGGVQSKTAQAICDRFNIIHLEKLNATDDSIPRKKPTLKRQKPNGLVDFIPEVNNICFKCYMSPCMCDIIIDHCEDADENGDLHNHIDIGSDTEENEEMDF